MKHTIISKILSKKELEKRYPHPKGKSYIIISPLTGRIFIPDPEEEKIVKEIIAILVKK